MESVDSVLVVGESLVDIVHGADGRTIEYAGGSAANVAVALARLGRRVRFVTAWADDDRGAVLARHLADAGVTLATDPHVLERTATAAATIGADGAASYEFDLDWRIGPVDPGRPVAVHVCSIGAVLEPGASQVVDLLRPLHGVATITYDVTVTENGQAKTWACDPADLSWSTPEAGAADAHLATVSLTIPVYPLPVA